MAAADITSAELARRLDDHERAVRRWRNGEVTPSTDNMTRLAMELNVDPGYFYTEHEEKAAA